MLSPSVASGSVPVENLPTKLDSIQDESEKFLHWIDTFDNGKADGKFDDLSEFYRRFQNGADASTHDLQRALIEYLDRNNNFHPLHDYILAEVISHDSIGSKDRASLENFWNLNNDQSCARRDYVGETLLSLKHPHKRPFAVKRLLIEVEGYKSDRDKIRIYKKFFNKLSKTQKRRLSRVVAPVVSKYDSLRFMYPDIVSSNELAQKSENFYRNEFKKLGRRKQCDRMMGLFDTMVKNRDSVKISMESMVERAKVVAKCYRRRGGINGHVAGWQKIGKILSKHIGQSGNTLAGVEIAKLHWYRDDYAKSKKIISNLLLANIGGPNSTDVFFPEAYGVLGHVYSELGMTSELEKSFGSLIDFSNAEDQFKGLKPLILEAAKMKDWPKALERANQLVAIEDRKKERDRDVSKHGYAIFWAARAALSLGQMELAVEFWKRLSTEYYSTYYGAMGHYLYERATGQSHLARKNLDVPFDEFSVLYAPFNDSSRYKIDRIKILLQMGKRESASCEIAELSDGNGRRDEYQIAAAKSVLYYLSGEWLKAVKMYGNLPRNFRKTLPGGFERILFPLKYDEKIVPLAENLDIDPFFVISLIRQESLFNPEAYSGAGAIGLMQMLKSTAKLESKRLLPAYVGGERAKYNLIRKASSKRNLFDPEINLKIGIHHVHSLLKEFGSEVFALIAYNAGPRRVDSWKKRFDTEDPVLFAEMIPFRETRGYVKLIMRNYFYYKRWYEASGGSFAHLENYLAPLLQEIDQQQALASR